jgi:hypothetical protein
MSFLEEFSNLLSRRTGISKVWAEDLASAALSTAVGPRVKLITKVAPLQLNLFFLNIGSSGLTVKSIALNNYFYDVLAELQEMTIGQGFLLPSTFTAEGLHNWFQVSTLKSGCVIQDEFSRLMKDVKSKKYMSGMLEYLSCLYDGRSPSRLTVAHGSQEMSLVFVNLVACSTPYLLTVMEPEQFFLQGTGNRFLYYVSEPSVRESGDSEEFFSPPNPLSGNVKSFAEMLKDYYMNTQNRDLLLTPEAGKILFAYRSSKEKEADKLYASNALDLDAPYIIRTPAFAMKFASLKAIDREGKIETKDPISLNKEDALYGTSRTEIHFQYFKRVRELNESLGAQQRAKVRGRDVQDVIRCLTDLGGHGTETDLHRLLHLNAEQIMQIEHELVETGQGRVEERETGKPGRPTNYIILRGTLPPWAEKKDGEDKT